MGRVVKLCFEPGVVDRFDRLSIHPELSQLGDDRTSISGLLFLCILMMSLLLFLFVGTRIATATFLLIG